MDLIVALRPGLSAILDAEDQVRWWEALDQPAPHSYADLARAHPALFDPESFAALRAQLDASAPLNAPTQAVLRQLAAYLAHLVEAAAAEPARRHAEQRNREPIVFAPDGRCSLKDALQRLRSSDRAERAALERGMDEALSLRSQPEEQRLEAAQKTAQRLGFPDYLALRTAVTGLDFEQLSKLARDFLARTKDAYEDVLLFFLRRTAGLPRGAAVAEARWHDLRAFLLAAPAQAVDAARLLSGVERWLNEAGLAPLQSKRWVRRLLGPGNGHSGVSTTPEANPGLVLQMDAGPEGAFALLKTTADLQRRQFALQEDPPEARALAHPTVRKTHAVLFAGLLWERAWLQRYAEVSKEASRDVARAYALGELSRLRAAAAWTLYQGELYRHGPTTEVRDRFASMTRDALGVVAPAGLWLFSVRPELTDAHRFEAGLLAAQLRLRLREKHDEDYFRNPAAGTWWKSRFARGARETTASLRAALALEPQASLSAAADELLSALSA
jgi:hypothetical protein